MDYDRLFEQIEVLQEQASVDAVYGQPIESGGKLVIPVASVSYAFGAGSQEDQDPQRGYGCGGVLAKPVAMVEITPDHIQVESVVDEQRIVMAGIAFAAWMIFWVARAAARILGRTA